MPFDIERVNRMRERILVQPSVCVERVDIIAYHKFGSSKYKEIGMEYGVQSEPLSEQEKEELLQIFLGKNLPAQLGG
jgi:hypothetical protein